MKSKLFRDNPPPAKGMSEDLDVIAGLKLSKEILGVLSKSVSEYVLAPYARSESKALESLRQRVALSPKELEAILRFGGNFLRKLDTSDTVDNIMADLETSAVLDIDKLKKVRPFIEAVVQEFEVSHHSQRLAQITQQSTIDNITGIEHTVDLRAVVANSLRLGDSVDHYKPKVDKLVPAAILRIKLSGDEEVVLQLDGFTLSVLQDELIAIERELKAAIALVGEDKVHSGRR